MNKIFCDSRNWADKPRGTQPNPVLILYKPQNSLSEIITDAIFLKVIQWSRTEVKKVKEIDLQLKHMWILWINVISALMADIVVPYILLEIQQQTLRWPMTDRIP